MPGWLRRKPGKCGLTRACRVSSTFALKRSPKVLSSYSGSFWVFPEAPESKQQLLAFACCCLFLLALRCFCLLLLALYWFCLLLLQFGQFLACFCLLLLVFVAFRRRLGISRRNLQWEGRPEPAEFHQLLLWNVLRKCSRATRALFWCFWKPWNQHSIGLLLLALVAFACFCLLFLNFPYFGVVWVASACFCCFRLLQKVPSQVPSEGTFTVPQKGTF